MREFRRILQAAGYADCGIVESMDPSAPIPPLLDEDSPPTSLNTLLRLFDREVPVTTEAAASAFAPLTVADLVEAGFVRQEGAKVSSNVQIEPYQDLLLVHPWGHEDEHSAMAISRSSLELANFTVRAPLRTTLDLGTGSGFQAMLAATHSEQVYAVDVNPLAIQSAEFNCVWNETRNIACLQGNLFDPIASQKFDLIVTNPPFVISPSAQVRYRDSGVRGDQFCLTLAREAARFLNEDGYFQMIFQWIETAGEDWRDKLSTAFSGLGCDVWVLRLFSLSPDPYVWAWLLESDGKPSPGTVSRLEWLRYLEELETQSIGTGLLILQRVSNRRNSLWFDESPDDRCQPYGAHIPGVLDIRRFVQEQTDSSLLGQKLVASPHLRMTQKSRLGYDAGERQSVGPLFGPNWRSTSAEFELEKGARYFFDNVDAVLARLVAGCDGKHRLHEIFEAAAAESGIPLADLTTKYLGEIRELIQYAFLLPAATAISKSRTSSSSRPSASLDRSNIGTPFLD